MFLTKATTSGRLVELRVLVPDPARGPGFWFAKQRQPESIPMAQRLRQESYSGARCGEKRRRACRPHSRSPRPGWNGAEPTHRRAPLLVAPGTLTAAAEHEAATSAIGPRKIYLRLSLLFAPASPVAWQTTKLRPSIACGRGQQTCFENREVFDECCDIRPCWDGPVVRTDDH